MPEQDVLQSLIPPAPAAQPGAEAPIAPPAASGSNLLSQLGLSQPNFAELDRAVGRSMAANTNAQAALASVAEDRADVVNDIENIPRPTAPNLQATPKAPETPPPTDTLRVFGQFLPMLAILGGSVIRNNATGALQAATAAMTAAKDNDAQALERANEQWQLNLQSVVSNNEQALQEYNAALALRESDMDGMLARLTALAAQEQNPVLQAQIAAGDLGAIGTAMNMRLQANQQIISAMEVISRANGGGGTGRPLRGTDGALMTRIRESAESARGLRGFTQEFNQSLSRAQQRGVVLGPGSGVQIWDPDVANMSALGARMLGLMRPTGSGATSDFEQRIYARGAPGVDRTPEANAAIIDGIDRLGAISDARQFYYEEFANQFGHLNGAERSFQQSPEFQSLAVDPNDRGAATAGGGSNDDPLGIRGDRTVSH